MRCAAAEDTEPFVLPADPVPGDLLTGSREHEGKAAVWLGMFFEDPQHYLLRPDQARRLAAHLRAHAADATAPDGPPEPGSPEFAERGLRRARSCNPPFGGWLQTYAPRTTGGGVPVVVLQGGPVVVLTAA
jgi:hypothetical protein